jgi:hypothetical protein
LQAFYDDDADRTAAETPEGLLAAADRVLKGQSINRDVYLDAVDTCKLLMAVRLGGVDPGNKERAVCAWLACAATLRTALGEDPFLALPIDQDTRDGDIGFDDADAARWAAEAVSAEIGRWNVQACREFWEWWLGEAVPAVWRIN